MLRVVASRFFSAVAPGAEKAVERKVGQVLTELSSKVIVWKPSSDAMVHLETKVGEQVVKLRVGVDFPEESLYKVLVDEETVQELNDFPSNWRRPGNP